MNKSIFHQNQAGSNNHSLPKKNSNLSSPWQNVNKSIFHQNQAVIFINIFKP